MGLEESKLTHSTKNSARSLKICASAPVIPWRIIHQCSPEQWKKCHREYFNFPDKPITCNYQLPNECTPAFCLTRQNIIGRKSSSVFALRKRKKLTKMAEHFEYNHLPARLSSIHNLHFRSVLASHSGLAVVHLTRDMITEFAVLDLRINKFLGSFGRQTVNFNPESTVGRISPDGNWCLIRLPSTADRDSSVLKLYDLKGCDLLTELFLSPLHTPIRPLGTTIRPPAARTPLAPHQEDNRLWPAPPPGGEHDLSVLATPLPAYLGDFVLAAMRSAPILFAFDPRFLHSRIAITNVNFGEPSEAHDWKPSISLMTLPTWERVARTTDVKCPSVASRTAPTSNTSTTTTPTAGAVSSSASTNPRAASGRRRASDALHLVDGTQSAGMTYTAPHVLSIFYSRDGYFLFVVSTEHRMCRCSVIGKHTTPSSILPTYSPVGSCEDASLADGGVRYTCPPQRSPPVVSFSIPDPGARSSKSALPDSPLAHSLMWTPTLPGCTTLWLTIFNSDTLARIRTLRFDRPICPIHTCPTNYLPIQSRCGSRLAMITNQYVSVTHRSRFASSPPPSSSNSPGRSTADQQLGTVLRHSVPAINTATYEQQQQQQQQSHSASSRGLNARMDAPMETRIMGSTNTSALDRCTQTLTRSSPVLPPGSGSASPPHHRRSPLLGHRCHPPGDHPRTTTTTLASLSCPFSFSASLLFTAPASPLPLSHQSSTQTMLHQTEVILVYQLPPPPSLQALIRQKIRLLVQDSMLDRLDLPARLINYLRFQPSFSCAGSCLSRSNSFNPTMHTDDVAEFHV